MTENVSLIRREHTVSHLRFFRIPVTRKSKQTTWIAKPEKTFPDKLTKQPSVSLDNTDQSEMGKE